MVFTFYYIDLSVNLKLIKDKYSSCQQDTLEAFKGIKCIGPYDGLLHFNCGNLMKNSFRKMSTEKKVKMGMSKLDYE